MAKRLRETPGPPQLGHNIHVLRGHQRLDFLKQRIRGENVLDAACGEGAFAIWAKETNHRVWAIDINDVGSWPHRYGIYFKRIALEDYEPHMLFDTIILMEIIEHLEEPEPIITKLYNALAPKGVLLITTPHVPDWDWEEDHIWRWTQGEFEAMILNITKHCRVWSDDIFIYAVMTNQEGGSHEHSDS